MEVECRHGRDRVLLDNLKRGNQLGCKQCYLERNRLPKFETEDERSLYYRIHSLFLRCENVGTHGYKQYRNVEIYKEWRSDPLLFVRYLLGLPGASLDKTIDRIDNDKGYVPGNLRWATAKEQAFNRRDTIKVNWNDEEMAFVDFATKYTKLSPSQALNYWHEGWTPEQLVNYEPKHIGARVRSLELRFQEKVRNSRKD